MDGKQITVEIIWRNRGSGQLGKEVITDTEDDISSAVRVKIYFLLMNKWSGFGDDGDSIEINYLEEEDSHGEKLKS